MNNMVLSLANDFSVNMNSVFLREDDDTFKVDTKSLTNILVFLDENNLLVSLLSGVDMLPFIEQTRTQSSHMSTVEKKVHVLHLYSICSAASDKIAQFLKKHY